MAELVVVKGAHRGECVRLADAPITIGRAKTAQLALNEDTKVSHVHARITPFDGDRYILEDLSSTNGTFVNDERIEQIPLRSGDLVRIGRSLLIFRLGGSSVHISDVNLAGGGSSHDIKPPPLAVAAPQPPPATTMRFPSRGDPRVTSDDAADDEVDEDEATGEGERLPGRPDDEPIDPLEGLLVAAVAPDLPSALERVAAGLLRGCGAERAFVFLRHPLTGGLGRAAMRAREGVPEGLVDADTLARAARGELVVTGRIAAGPVPGAGTAPLGAVYVDRFDRPPAEVTRLLSSAGAVTSLVVSGDRARRLADAAIDIVALAQERVARQPIDLVAVLAAVDRTHGPVARQRGIPWRVSAAGQILVLADPALLTRGLNHVIDHVLTVARGDVRLVAAVGADGRVRAEISRPRIEPPEVVQRLADPEGVVADLRRARSDAGGDGALAVGRVALLRAGVRLSVAIGPDERVTYTFELEQAR